MKKYYPFGKQKYLRPSWGFSQQTKNAPLSGAFFVTYIQF